MSILISSEAEADLEIIADFIAIENPRRSISFVQEMVLACNSLAEHPLRHPIKAEFSRQVRRFAYRGYSIYYEVRASDDVVIVHVLNDALDHRRYFSQI